MFRSNSIMVSVYAGTLFLAFCLFPQMNAVWAESDGVTPVYSPVVNGEALRGLSTIGSAESVGAGAFSYGVNSHVDLFGSIAGFSMNNYGKTGQGSGLGTIRAGAQGSLPFPQYAFLRMGGQAAIIGGTSANQINTYRADGYNYFETRTGYTFIGKLMQTAMSGNEDWGIKLHVNEAGVIGIRKNEPTLLLLGAGLQANVGFAVLGAEFARKQKTAQEKAALENKAASSARQVQSLSVKSLGDSIALAEEKRMGRMQMDSMNRKKGVKSVKNEMTVEKAPM